MTPRLIIFALLFLGLHTCVPAFSQNNPAPRTIQGPGHFYTGNDYLEESNSLQQTYLTGLFDGFLAAEFFGAPDGRVTQVNGCLKGKTNAQLHAIVAKYLRERPERWDEPMSVLTFNALNTSCGRFDPLVKSD